MTFHFLALVVCPLLTLVKIIALFTLIGCGFPDFEPLRPPMTFESFPCNDSDQLRPISIPGNKIFTIGL